MACPPPSAIVASVDKALYVFLKRNLHCADLQIRDLLYQRKIVRLVPMLALRTPPKAQVPKGTLDDPGVAAHDQIRRVQTLPAY